MSENKVNNLLGVSMDKIKEMVDVNTVIGDPITAPDGTTVIPVSRVSYGFAGGGSDLPSKTQPEKGLFAGGSGAGAAVVAAVENGYCEKDRDITVKVRGGILTVRYTTDGVVTLTGDAKLIFTGEVRY